MNTILSTTLLTSLAIAFGAGVYIGRHYANTRMLELERQLVVLHSRLSLAQAQQRGDA